MIVSMQMVVLPVERSPMISSRWPRPIGIIASIAMMPVCTGWLTGLALDDAGRDLLDRIELRLPVIGPLPSSGSPRRVDDAAEQALADGHREQLARSRRDLAAFLELRVIAEDDRADLGLLEVQREADDAVAEVEHLVEHRVGEAFDLGHAVADLADDADVLLGGRRFGSRDLGFDFLDQVAIVHRHS